ncbi:hypothetical protein GCM10011331_25290 [Flavimobilis marinus]|nr:hypothetical protein GCM10011331_25290 [Flavimobilis marinus]
MQSHVLRSRRQPSRRPPTGLAPGRAGDAEALVAALGRAVRAQPGPHDPPAPARQPGKAKRSTSVEINDQFVPVALRVKSSPAPVTT